MKIKFCGAAQTVTGSSHLIILDDGFKILLDCGMFQGAAGDLEELNSHWYFDPAEIDAMILSHAHIDHCGKLPKLVKDGFRGKIYSTHATRDLASIMLMDTAHIQERDAEYHNEKVIKKLKASNSKQKAKLRLALYSSRDVTATIKQFVSCSYGQTISINKNVKLTFTDAGHILGSSSINLMIREGSDELRLGFTGDIGRPNRPILSDPMPMNLSDVIISESTYGDKLHIEKPAEKNKFLDIILSTCVTKSGKLIIPAFSLGRTQEIVFILDQLVNERKLPSIPVYVDSPLAVNATDIFRSHPECFDHDLHQYILRDADPFGFKQLHYITDVNESKRLNKMTDPCIIISASGMMNAGRIKHHVYNNISNPRNTILIPGYCSPDTPGGALRSGATEIHLFGDTLPVLADIEMMDSFSAHGDQREMTTFLENQNTTVKKLFLVHGEKEVQTKFADHLQQSGFSNINIPAMGETVDIM